ncbi:MAG: DMT family transporter [Methanobacteriota archaeon]|nr:MAG: DMT family transporter [Euryarchaeota archaeon]
MALLGRPERGWTLHASLTVLILFWGLAFVAIKQALAYMSWMTLTFLRFAVADVLFVGYLVATRQVRHPPTRNDLPMLVILAFLGFTGYHLFLNLGETDPNVSAGTAALIIASAPAFIAIFAIPLLKERIGALAIRGDRPRLRGPRGDNLLRPAGESIHVPRFRRRPDGGPARDFLRPLCGPRQELTSGGTLPSRSSGTESGSARWSESPPRRRGPTSTRARSSRSSAGS